MDKFKSRSFPLFGARRRLINRCIFQGIMGERERERGRMAFKRFNLPSPPSSLCMNASVGRESELDDDDEEKIFEDGLSCGLRGEGGKEGGRHFGLIGTWRWPPAVAGPSLPPPRSFGLFLPPSSFGAKTLIVYRPATIGRAGGRMGGRRRRCVE